MNGLIFVWWVLWGTKIDVTFVHYLLLWTRILPGLSGAPPPPPNSEVVQFQDNHGNLKSPFFWWLWHLGFHPFVLITQWWRGVRHGHVSCSRLTEGSQLFDFSIFPSSQIRPFLLFFSFKSYIFSLSLCFFFLLELYYLLSLPLMVGYSDIRRTSPSVAFFFARLGVFLCSFSDHYPRVRDLF